MEKAGTNSHEKREKRYRKIGHISFLLSSAEGVVLELESDGGSSKSSASSCGFRDRRSVWLWTWLRVPGVEAPEGPDDERAELSAISFLKASNSRSNLQGI